MTETRDEATKQDSRRYPYGDQRKIYSVYGATSSFFRKWASQLPLTMHGEFMEDVMRMVATAQKEALEFHQVSTVVGPYVNADPQ